MFIINVLQKRMVRTERLELSHLSAPEPKSGVSTNFTTSAYCDISRACNGVGDGARTHDHRNHNPGLYQLSYAHHYKFFQVRRWHALQDSNPRPTA